MSNEKSPVGSVGDASMSPRSSQTTNVLPSRIRTTWPAIVSPSACRWFAPTTSSFAASGPGKSRWKRTSSAGSPSRRIWPRSVAAMALARPTREILEHRRVRPDDAVGRSGVTRHGHGPSTHVHPPMLGAAVALQVQAQAGGRAAEQRLGLASAEPLEESCRRVSHRDPWRGRSTDVVGMDVTDRLLLSARWSASPRPGEPQDAAGRARYTLRRASGGMADAPALGAGAA